MAIIKLTQQKHKVIDPTKTGADNLKLISETIILFNTNEMIIAEPNYIGGTTITYKKALTDAFNCKETLEEIQKLIKQTKENR
jgi:hypothetical protein